MTQPFKLLIVTPTLGEYGGIEAMVLNLAKTFNTHPHFTVRVCFKCVKGFTLKPRLKEIFTDADINFLGVKRHSFALFKEIWSADIVHAQNVSPDVVFFSKLAQKPILLHIHHWCRRHFSLHTILWRLCAHLANYRTYVSHFVWNSWEPKHHRRLSKCMPSVPELSNQLAAFEQRKGFVFVSRWIKNKGLRTLLKAYEQANINKEAWPLTLIGDGPLKDWVTEYLANTPLSTVSCLGFVSQEKKHHLIAQSKWLVAPPNTHEDLGMTPIEARALGIPSIITRDGGLPEAAGPGALICEPGNTDALAKLLEQASSMPEPEYQQRALMGKTSLGSFLKNPKEYETLYTTLLMSSTT